MVFVFFFFFFYRAGGDSGQNSSQFLCVGISAFSACTMGDFGNQKRTAL